MNYYIPDCFDAGCDSYYGGYRTRTFTQIFSEDGETGTYEAFAAMLADTPFAARIKAANIDTELLFYLLYSHYGNSHISYSDEHQFVYSLFSIIMNYGPAWAKRLAIQDELNKLSLEEGSDIYHGAKAIYNHAYNPGTEPSTQTLTELPQINEQNTTNYRKSKLEGLANLAALLRTDVTENFLSKFRKLFIKVVAPDRPLLYTTYQEDII